MIKENWSLLMLRNWECRERHLNEEFPWDKQNLVFKDLVIGPQLQIDKSALTKMEKGKASGTSGVVTEMFLASGVAGLEKMTSL